MNRKYTRGQYLEKVDRLRQSSPEISISSDIIVGFPGETDEDFGETLDLIRRLQYDSLFVFNYSDRPLAPSRKFPDKVEEGTKADRLQRVLDLQASIANEINSRMVGKIEPVLVEGHSKRQQSNDDTVSDPQWTGRTLCNKIVNFAAEGPYKKIADDIAGATVTVRIEKALSHSLWGKITDAGLIRPERKGENSYAA